MKASFEAINTDKIDFTLTVTMPLKEWKNFRDSIPDGWPNWRFKEQINEMVSQAQRTFYPTSEADPPQET